MELPYYKPIAYTDILIFGPVTPFFISFIAFIYLMLVGGFLKGIYSSLIFNLLVLLATIFLNNTFNLGLDYLSLVAFQIFLSVVWILGATKT